jgi:hypothetical protein
LSSDIKNSDIKKPRNSEALYYTDYYTEFLHTLKFI